jgi:hypothetical protein
MGHEMAFELFGLTGRVQGRYAAFKIGKAGIHEIREPFEDVCEGLFGRFQGEFEGGGSRSS